MKQKLTRLFKNRLIIIDEVHNIRMTDDNSDKKVAMELMKLVQNVKHMRLLLLSATPMYNSYKEIIWLLNLLNTNDGRALINTSDVFNADGTFKFKDGYGDVGRDLLIRKATGYVSFVRGENPYTYPFRVWPSEFAPEKTIIGTTYPKVQMNGTGIVGRIEHLSVFLCKIGKTQQAGYDYIIDRLKNDDGKDSKRVMPSFENMEGFGYTLLQRPLEALNIVYPDNRLGKKDFDPKDLVGKAGLSRLVKFRESKAPIFRGEFEYRTTEYGTIFSPEQISLYSGKINNICESVLKSEGVILIYSQYIDGGLVPIALALESMGMRRAEYPSLFKHHQAEEIDAITFKHRSEMSTGETFSTASYVMITGDKAFSPDNVADLKRSTNIDNKNGEKVKVILISQAGSEGLDFKFIRQVHVLEPWYNMNRIEQIIGRAVRTCSHKDLPFLLRNVQIFLYGSIMARPEEEAADLYVYRLAELKAVQIGLVSRALKESAVDCILNIDQTKFAIDKMKTAVEQKLSTGLTINYAVGDRPYTSTCDYMESCSYTCRDHVEKGVGKIISDTYNESFIMLNNDKIIQRIRDAFKEKFFYSKKKLIGEINAVISYSDTQINAALNQLIEDKHEYIVDMYDRIGRLINIGDLYLFQPLEINDTGVSLYDRSVPIEYKRHSLIFETTAPDKAPGLINDKKVSTKGKVLLHNMRSKYIISMTPKPLDTKSGDWYIFCSAVIPFLQKDGWERQLINKLIVHHIIESLRFDDMLLLINYLENVDTYEDDEFILTIKQYIENIELKSKSLRSIHLQNTGERQLIVFDKKLKMWDIAKPEDYEDLRNELGAMINKIMPMSVKLSTHIGFMVNFKKDYMIFKIRNIGQKRNTGARCDQASKLNSIQLLNSLGEHQYTMDIDLSRPELCVIQELLLRKFDIENKDDKRWFLTPAEAVIINSKTAI